MDVEEVRKSGIVARQEVVKRRRRVKNQSRVEDVFGEGLVVNGPGETE